MIKQKIEWLWDTYKKWPWWKKILGAGVFVLIVILGVLYFLNKLVNPSPLPPLDNLHTEHADENIKPLIEENEALKKDVDQKKKEIVTRLNQATSIDQTTLDRRAKIEKANSMEELDALQKEFGL